MIFNLRLAAIVQCRLNSCNGGEAFAVYILYNLYVSTALSLLDIRILLRATFLRDIPPRDVLAHFKMCIITSCIKHLF